MIQGWILWPHFTSLQWPRAMFSVPAARVSEVIQALFWTRNNYNMENLGKRITPWKQITLWMKLLPLCFIYHCGFGLHFRRSMRVNMLDAHRLRGVHWSCGLINSWTVWMSQIWYVHWVNNVPLVMHVDCYRLRDSDIPGYWCINTLGRMAWIVPFYMLCLSGIML